jgi:hypothetical protein
MTPDDRRLLIEMHTDIKFLRQSHEAVVKDVEALKKDTVSKSALATILTVFGVLLTGIASFLGLYHK